VLLVVLVGVLVLKQHVFPAVLVITPFLAMQALLHAQHALQERTAMLLVHLCARCALPAHIQVRKGNRCVKTAQLARCNQPLDKTAVRHVRRGLTFLRPD
jgi:hypothetical protein